MTFDEMLTYWTLTKQMTYPEQLGNKGSKGVMWGFRVKVEHRTINIRYLNSPDGLLIQYINVDSPTGINWTRTGHFESLSELNKIMNPEGEIKT